MTDTTSADPAVFGARLVERLGVNSTTRRERVVHSLDGLLEPVTADEITITASRLWAACLREFDLSIAPDFLLGLDAGGIVPALGLALASGLPYKIAWKLRLPLPGAVRFTEPHAVRREVYAYGIEPGQRILLVDDEVTTGRTLANLAHTLREAGAEPLGAACLVEDPRHDARRVLRDAGLSLVSLTTLAIRP